MMGIERAIIGEFPALIRERKEEIILMHPRLFLADFMDALTFWCLLQELIKAFCFFVRGSFLQAVLAEAGLATCGEAKAFGLYLMLVRPPGFYLGEVRPKAEPNQNKTLEAEQASDKGQRPEPNHTWQAPPRQAQPAERIPEQKTKSLDQLLQQTSECQSVHKIRQKNPGKCIKIISSFCSLINPGNSPITAMRYPSFTLWYWKFWLVSLIHDLVSLISDFYPPGAGYNAQW